MKRMACLAAVVLLLSVTMDAGRESGSITGLSFLNSGAALKLAGDKIITVPYLEHRPDVVPIDIGRQLFVDDFLIEKSDLKRVFHYPTRYEGNPVLKPQTPTELGQFAEKEANGNAKPTAAMISDGFCYDSREKLFKLWYQAGWRDGTNLAVSEDGLAWTRPETRH